MDERMLWGGTAEYMRERAKRYLTPHQNDVNEVVGLLLSEIADAIDAGRGFAPDRQSDDER